MRSSGNILIGFLSVFACLIVAAPVANASWLSDITGVNIDVPGGKISINQPHPEHIPQMIQNLPRDAANFFLNPAGPQLAFLIRQARAQAEPSSQPIPQNIRDALSPYFPDRILSVARFTTSGQSSVSLATGVMEANNDTWAVTVDNIIVFRGGAEMQDLGHWAHELVHVAQYQNMGIDGFAAMYAGPGAQTIENDAYSWQNHVVALLNASPRSSVVSQQQWIDSGAPDRQLTWDDFHQAALQVIPPQQCARLQQIAPNVVSVANACGIGLVVTIVYMNGFPTSCNGPVCFFPPNNTHVIGGPPGNVTGFNFIFAQ